MASEGSSVDGRRKRKELLNYYGSLKNDIEASLDINSKHFNPEFYVQKAIKEKNLKHLLEEESSLVNDIQRLDSECQTLVYDHYDKFIAATDIVRQMKEGSAQMSAQVSQLQENMQKITVSSENITKDLQGRRDKLSHLLGIHSTLKKLQFLFHLPQKIDECIKEKKFSEGVRSYVETAEVLQRYQHLPSFTAIHKDCQDALIRLNKALKNELAIKEGSTRQLTLCVDLLFQLGEPAEALCDDFLSHARIKLEEDLNSLTALAQGKSLSEGDPKNEENLLEQETLDILQFIDVCHDTFVGNLWLVISSYKEMFLRTEEFKQRNQENIPLEKLHDFVSSLMEEYVSVVGVRIAAEDGDSQEYQALTTALDKFHRRLHAITQLMPNSDFSDKSLELIFEAAEDRCKASLKWLQDSFVSNLADVRQALVSPKQVTQGNSTSAQLNELLTQLVASTAANIKDRVSALLAFNQPKHTYAMRSDFRHRFSRELIREGLVIAFFRYITESLRQFCDKKDKDPSLLLLLSRMCLDLHTSTVHYLLTHCDEQLQLEDKRGLTPYSVISAAMKETGQELLNHYVTSQGNSISQMLRRSIELKDWLGCSEPRSVRRVMRTVRDELVAMDTQVGALYEEGIRKDRSSDSSRRTFHSVSISRIGGGARSVGWSGYGSAALDNSLVANLNKLWSERIEIFAPVEFTRMSILTGIIKISLKTLLESVRLKTFSRFGFQQVQVDTHYLRTYLWSYVADEKILNVLLDEVLTSASLRATDSELMELKVVEFICEQN
ncbi:UNVERIFIED_CONTAM: hypothetical protein RMT77_005793 [Armadillidium vulgare]